MVDGARSTHDRQDLEPSFPAPLELWSANTGNGWSDLSRTVAMVLPDPRIHASDTELYRGFPTELVIGGTGLWRGSSNRGKLGRRGDTFYEAVPPRLDFDPPIDPWVFRTIYVNVSSPAFLPGHFPMPKQRDWLYSGVSDDVMWLSS